MWTEQVSKFKYNILTELNPGLLRHILCQFPILGVWILLYFPSFYDANPKPTSSLEPVFQPAEFSDHGFGKEETPLFLLEIIWQYCLLYCYTVKKGQRYSRPYPGSLTELPLGGIVIIIKLFQPRESFVSDIPGFYSQLGRECR